MKRLAARLIWLSLLIAPPLSSARSFALLRDATA
jgi:hypothetical protein